MYVKMERIENSFTIVQTLIKIPQCSGYICYEVVYIFLWAVNQTVKTTGIDYTGYLKSIDHPIWWHSLVFGNNLLLFCGIICNCYVQNTRGNGYHVIDILF